MTTPAASPAPPRGSAVALAGPDEDAERRALRADRRQTFGLGVLVTLLVTAVAFLGPRAGGLLGILDRVESDWLDLEFRLRGPMAPDPRIALVAIDQPAIDRFGRFPFERQVLADTITRLDELGARQILLDLVISEPVDPLQDAALADAIAGAAAPVVLGYFFYTGDEEEGAAQPSPRGNRFVEQTPTIPLAIEGEPLLLRSRGVQPCLESLQAVAAGVGYLNLRADRGGIVRRTQLVIAHADGVYPSLEIPAAAHARLGPGGSGMPAVLTGTRLQPRLELADLSVALDPSGAALVNYVGPPSVYPTASLVDVLADVVDAETAALVRDRIVLLGPWAVGIWDRRDTPFGASVPAVTIHAAVLDNLLQQRFLARPPWVQLLEWTALLLVGLALSLLLARAPLWVGGVAAGLAALTAPAIGYAAFATAGVWVKPLPMVFEAIAMFTAISALRWRHEALRREREVAARAKVTSLFGRYVSPDVIARMLADPRAVRLGGERRELTVLFSDIRSFTSLSEGMDPEQLGPLLNAYLGAMTDAIQDAGGMLDKFIGDGIMALFGAPLAQPDHAARACAAALAKQAALAALNERLLADGAVDEPLRIGIGLNSGEAIVGNMGSDQRFEYTAVGDEVNLAARLEGITKFYGVGCVISASTRDAVGDAFHVRELDRAVVKGRETPVRIFELIGARDDGPPPAHVAPYERALTALQQRRWDDADRALDEVEALQPGDGPATMLRTRVAGLRASPPDDSWDGSHVFDTK